MWAILNIRSILGVETCINQEIEEKILNYVENSQDFKERLAKCVNVQTKNIDRVEFFMLDFEGYVTGRFSVYIAGKWTAKIWFYRAKFSTVTGDLQGVQINKRAG